MKTLPAVADGTTRCGVDTVDVARIERLLAETPAADLRKIFSEQELSDAGTGPGRAAALAARFAAKEACAKLFPRELALGAIGPTDFAVTRDAYGAPAVELSEAGEIALGRNRLRAITLSLTHDRTQASAVALAQAQRATPSKAAQWFYRLVPFRRQVVLENLRRVYGEVVDEHEIERLAQAHYGHLGHLLWEFIRFPWLSRTRKLAMARVENLDALLAAHALGKGVLILTGHFGNFEVATTAGLAQYPQAHGRFHFVRRPIRPAWLDAWVTRRFRHAGFGVLPKRGGLEAILDRLAAGDLIVFPFDQHASRRDGVMAEFFGHPAGTFRSLAVIAMTTGAPVVPAASWREPDGRHVLRFEEQILLVDNPDTNEAIRLNTRAYNRALERLIIRRPEQWWWVHRRWKPWPTSGKR
ncbi:MAG TPA: 4'-phosphopantetheinyl transferase superfamily protein [Burkholderiaceae bacterium]|nr:4'-phosphopantetheinyl transferase superfamily protein [Burkholderiaceae bacterium]